MAIDRRTLRWNGWGPADRPSPLPDGAPQWAWLRQTLGMADLAHTPAKALGDIAVPASRLDDGAARGFRAIVGDEGVRRDDYERAFHARGQSYHDLLRLRAGDLGTPPDAVVYPRGAEQVQAVLDLCVERDIAVIPFGGGSSVVGGVTPPPRSAKSPKPAKAAVVSLDMTLMDELLAVDPESLTATVQAGVYGPALEAALGGHGLTLGHYPQSFEYSTLGGWIAARGAGQQSNRYGKAEAWLVSARLATPKGPWSTEGAPASAAGPDLARLVAGSEGTLGVICDATVKVRAAPQACSYRGYLFRDFAAGVETIRAISQAGVPVAMLRLSDAPETRFLAGFSDPAGAGGLKRRLQEAWIVRRGFGAGRCLMLVGLEGDRQTVAFARARTAALCRRAGAIGLGPSIGERWYRNRFALPYARDPLLDRGIGVDTLETAALWSSLLAVHKAVTSAIGDALTATLPSPANRAAVMAHVSHSYRDGASLYFTFVFPRDTGHEVDQWLAVKRAASDAIAARGATISHHHGVGTDHAPWLAAEKGPVGMSLLRALKRELDPTGILNPGKLME